MILCIEVLSSCKLVIDLLTALSPFFNLPEMCISVVFVMCPVRTMSVFKFNDVTDILFRLNVDSICSSFGVHCHLAHHVNYSDLISISSSSMLRRTCTVQTWAILEFIF